MEQHADVSSGINTSKGLALERIGTLFLRSGLVIAIGWIAAMKATHYEAVGIQPLIANSPFMSWIYKVWSLDTATKIVGITEGIIVLLIASRRWSPKACAVGSAGAVIMFLTTLSFMISTPGWEPSLGGFPALSGGVGEFLIKDLVLLGASLWSLGESSSRSIWRRSRKVFWLQFRLRRSRRKTTENLRNSLGVRTRSNQCASPSCV
jgi:reactive chlorine resistance protein C